jgi:hypothetical protein
MFSPAGLLLLPALFAFRLAFAGFQGVGIGLTTYDMDPCRCELARRPEG